MIKFLLTFFAVLPLRMNHFIGTLIGHYLYLSHSRSKRVVRQNILLCFPDLSHQNQQKLIKKTLIETGKGLSELGFVWLNSFEHNAKQVKKTNGIACLKSDRAVILLVPHFGCWEIAARVLSLAQPAVFLYKPLKNKAQQALLIHNRQQGSLSMAAADKKGIIKLQRALSKKKVIGILPDQDPGEEGGVLAPFFGVNARTMTLLVRLARKNNAKIIMAWAERLPQGQGYELNLKPVELLSDSGNLIEEATRMNQAIEDLVRTQPEQYLWNYKRFKSVIDY